jgi:hypothetical protein
MKLSLSTCIFALILMFVLSCSTSIVKADGWDCYVPTSACSSGGTHCTQTWESCIGDGTFGNLPSGMPLYNGSCQTPYVVYGNTCDWPGCNLVGTASTWVAWVLTLIGEGDTFGQAMQDANSALSCYGDPGWLP